MVWNQKLVGGNSFLRGCRVENVVIFEDEMVDYGIAVVSKAEREIPARHRYLPPPSGVSPLASRMRVEVVLEGAAL
jgi:hypothetical protein